MIRLREISGCIAFRVEVRGEVGPMLTMTPIYCGWDGIGPDCADEILDSPVLAMYSANTGEDSVLVVEVGHGE